MSDVRASPFQFHIMADERILVVDDEDSIREVICRHPESGWMECRPVTSATEALAVLQSESGFAACYPT